MPARPQPQLGASVPFGPVILDTNVFINALGGRGSPALRLLLENLPRAFVAAPTRAELAWIRGSLDPSHPNTRRALALHDELLRHIDAAKVLVPSDMHWLAAGELAGGAARSLAGGSRKLTTAFDRTELIFDALTAILACDAGFTVVTEDADFAVLARLAPALRVLFYDRAGAAP